MGHAEGQTDGRTYRENHMAVPVGLPRDNCSLQRYASTTLFCLSPTSKIPTKIATMPIMLVIFWQFDSSILRDAMLST